MSNNLIVEFFLKYEEFKLFVVQLKLDSVMINNVVSILMKLMKTSSKFESKHISINNRFTNMWFSVF